MGQNYYATLGKFIFGGEVVCFVVILRANPVSGGDPRVDKIFDGSGIRREQVFRIWASRIGPDDCGRVMADKRKARSI